MPSNASIASRNRPPIHWLVPLALAAVFFSAALAGVASSYASVAALVLLGIYLLLAFTLYFLLLLGRALGKVPGYLAAVAVASILVYHVRELSYWPTSLFAVPAAGAVAAAPLYLAVDRWRPRWPWRRTLAALLAASLLFAVALIGAFETSGVLRWHLLRHNKMLGTPAHYLLEPAIADVEQRLFGEHRGADAQLPPTPAEQPGGTGQEPGADLRTRPHVVFLMLDTLRADALEMGGGPRAWMPRLNALLEGSYRFTDVVANASWTRPSVASFFTGQLPEEHGARDIDDPLVAEHRTLPEVFRDLGWETAAFVSNVGAVGENAGFAQGFDFFHEFEADPYARASRIRRTVEGWLEQRHSDASLFLYLHYLDPHEPYLAGREPARKSRAEFEAAYRAELAYLDGELDRLFVFLKQALPGPLALFVASDHGEEFGEHEEFGHGVSLYREVIRVPVAFHTGGGGGGEVSVPLEGRDFFDLLARFAERRGELAVDDWARRARRSSRYYSVYYSSRGRLALRPYLRKVCMRAVEHDGYKLVWSAYGSTWELYDLERDPGELDNLAAVRPDLVAELAATFDDSVSFWTFPPPYERSPEELEQLRALGYLGD